MSGRWLQRDVGDCPDCGLPVRPYEDPHDCPAIDDAERVYDRWETLRGTPEGER